MGYTIERPLEPPEPRIRIAFTCEICEDPVYEGEDYYDIPTFGKCCADCINSSKCHDAEACEDDNSDALYDEWRDGRYE